MSEPAPSAPSITRQFAVPAAIAVVLACLALWQDRLSLGILVFLLMTLGWLLIRILITDATALPVASSVGGRREAFLIQGVGVGMMYLPAIAIATPLLDFAGFNLPWGVNALGVGLALPGLWLFWRSHADLGTYWSPALELREGHQLVTHGVYARIRHPMYAALFLITAAQACFLGNWIAGPSGFIAFGALYLLRIDYEEQMMAEAFASDWSAYSARTGRLLPSTQG